MYKQSPYKFQVQCCVVPVPKSGKEHQLKQNIDICDFDLDAEDFEKMRSLNKNERSETFPG